MAMSDKERILIYLVNWIYRKALYDPAARNKWLDMQPGLFSSKINPLQPGDLVTTMTTIFPNEWMVGYVHEVKPDCVVIREIGSDRLCNYSNESFMRIDKEILGYEILEGAQYKTYKKVLKAFSESSFKFKSISFDGPTCTVEGRRLFSSETAFTFSFDSYASKTIKAITAMVNHEETKDSAIDSPFD